MCQLHCPLSWCIRRRILSLIKDKPNHYPFIDWCDNSYIATNNDVFMQYLHNTRIEGRGTWCRIGRVEAFRPEGRGFESRSVSAMYIGTLGKSLTRSCLWRFGVKLRHSTRAVSRAPLSSGLEEAL